MGRVRSIALLCVLVVLASQFGAPGSPFIPTPALASEGDESPIGSQELTELRTQRSKTFLDADGSKTARFFTGPVHYQASDGSWSEIVNTLVPSDRSGYAWRNSAGSFYVHFKAVADSTDMVLVTDGTRSISFGFDGVTNPSPGVVSGSTITYPNVRPGMDLVYEMRSGEVKEFVVLDQAPTEPLVLDFPLALDGLDAIEAGSGTIELDLPSGIAEFTISDLWMKDSSVHPESGDPAFSEDVAATLVGSGSTPTLRVTPDLGWLQDPARVYPVTIDPTVQKNVETNDDTYIQSNIFNTDVSGENEMKSGTYDGGTTKARSLMKFADVGTAIPNGATITGTKLNVWEFHSFSCTARAVDIHRINDSWDGNSVRWSNQPPVGASQSSVTVAKGWSSSCPANWVEFPTLGTVVQYWKDNPSQNFGLMIKSPNETTNDWWKKWHPIGSGHKPYLDVIYSEPDTVPPGNPTVSSSTHPTTGDWYSSCSPSFSWTAPNDDSGIAGYSTQFNQSEGFIPDNNIDVTGTSQSPGTFAEGTWWFHARAKDNAGNWGYDAGHRKVNMDCSPPSSPVISSSHTEGGLSTNDDPSFSWSASSDSLSGVAGYSFILDRNSGTDPTTGLVSGTSTSYSNIEDGDWWFHVRTKNGAGAWSLTDHYQVRIDDSGPAVNLSSGSHPSESTWYVNDDPSFGWSANDPNGIAGYSFMLDQVPGNTPDSSIEGSGTSMSYSDLQDGTWHFHVMAKDNAGNWGQAAHRTVRIDDSAPSDPVISSTTHTENGWSTNRSPQFSFTSSDSASGIAGYSFAFDHNSETLPDEILEGSATSQSYSGIAPGDWWFHVRAKNNSGLWSNNADHFLVRIDDGNGPSVTVSSSSHPSEDAWYANDNPTFSWSGFDSSGVGGYSYLVDQSSSTDPDMSSEGTGTSTTTTDLSDGTWFFHVKGRDGSNTWGQPAHRRVRIDDTAPSISTFTSSLPEGSWSKDNDPRFDWLSSDVSGIDGYSYVMDQSSSTDPNPSLISSDVSKVFADVADGSHWFHVRARNGSALWSPTRHFGVQIDATAPSSPSIGSSTHPAQGTTYPSNDPVFTWSASDATSGVAGYSYELDQSDATTPDTTSEGLGTSKSYANKADGTWWFHVRARDVAGNWGPAEHFEISIDVPAPFVSVALHAPAGQADEDGLGLIKDGDAISISGSVREGQGGSLDPIATLSSCQLVITDDSGTERTRRHLGAGACAVTGGMLNGSFSAGNLGVDTGSARVELSVVRGSKSSGTVATNTLGVDNVVPAIEAAERGCHMITLFPCLDQRTVVIEFTEAVQGELKVSDFSIEGHIVAAVEASCTPEVFCASASITTANDVAADELPVVSYSYDSLAGLASPAPRDRAANVMTTSDSQLDDPDAVEFTNPIGIPDASDPELALPITPLGEVMIITANIKQKCEQNDCALKLCDPQDPPEKPYTGVDCGDEVYKEHFAKRIKVLTQKDRSESGDGMGDVLPDIILLQEAGCGHADRVAAELNGRVNAQRSEEDVVANPYIALCITKRDRQINRDGDAKKHELTDPKRISDGPILYNSASIEPLVEEGVPSRLTMESRYLGMERPNACLGADEGSSAIGAGLIDVDDDKDEDCQVVYKRHLALPFVEEQPAPVGEEEVVALRVAVANVHFVRGAKIASDATVVTRWLSHPESDTDRFPTGIAQRMDEAYGDHVHYLSIGGDLNTERCQGETEEDDVDCATRTWWNTLTGTHAYSDMVLAAHPSTEGMKSQYRDGCIEMDEDGGCAPDLDGERPRRVDFIFTKLGTATEMPAMPASHDLTCGIIDSQEFEPNCDFPSNPEKYSDHRLVWGLISLVAAEPSPVPTPTLTPLPTPTVSPLPSPSAPLPPIPAKSLDVETSADKGRHALVPSLYWFEWGCEALASGSVAVETRILSCTAVSTGSVSGASPGNRVDVSRRVEDTAEYEHATAEICWVAEADFVDGTSVQDSGCRSVSFLE